MSAFTETVFNTCLVIPQETDRWTKHSLDSTLGKDRELVELVELVERALIMKGQRLSGN